jgi:hypothetical protein
MRYDNRRRFRNLADLAAQVPQTDSADFDSSGPSHVLHSPNILILGDEWATNTLAGHGRCIS